MEPFTFQPRLPKFLPKKPALKKLLIFSQKSPLFSGNGNPEKIFLFQETKHSYISGKVYSEL